MLTQASSVLVVLLINGLEYCRQRWHKWDGERHWVVGHVLAIAALTIHAMVVTQAWWPGFLGAIAGLATSATVATLHTRWWAGRLFHVASFLSSAWIVGIAALWAAAPLTTSWTWPPSDPWNALWWMASAPGPAWWWATRRPAHWPASWYVRGWRWFGRGGGPCVR